MLLETPKRKRGEEGKEEEIEWGGRKGGGREILRVVANLRSE